MIQARFLKSSDWSTENTTESLSIQWLRKESLKFFFTV